MSYNDPHAIPPKQLGYLFILLGALNLIATVYFVVTGEHTVENYVTVALCLVAIICGYGLTLKNHIAFWICLIIAVVMILAGVLRILVAAGVFSIDGVSASWVSAICTLIVGLILTSSTVTDKKLILE